jgi:hypothetical protein
MDNTYVTESMQKHLFQSIRVSGHQSLAHLWDLRFGNSKNVVTRVNIYQTAKHRSLEKFIAFLQEAISDFLTTQRFVATSQQLSQPANTDRKVDDSANLHEFTPHSRCLTEFILPEVYFLKKKKFQEWVTQFTKQEPYQRNKFFMFI